MNASKLLLYGANGYTAQLMLPLLERYGLSAVLAGRSAEKIEPLARKFGLDYRIFDLKDPQSSDAGVSGMALVLHCAGPFSQTARPMMEACLRMGVHYLDITGEIAVFELAAQWSEQARARGILLLPGTGFDVVPTDCTALLLKKQLPDATHLQLAFASVGGGVSQGTAKTMVENLGGKGAIRQNGQIVPVPPGFKAMTVDFGPVQRFVMTISWGDVSTAFHSTGIPNVEVYMAVPPKSYEKMRHQRWLAWWFRLPFVQAYLKKQVEKRPPGPSDEKRAKAKSYVWGKVWNAAGESRETRLECPEGYTLTAHSALLIAQKVLHGTGKTGFWTPAGLFGENLITEVKERMRREER